MGEGTPAGPAGSGQVTDHAPARTPPPPRSSHTTPRKGLLLSVGACGEALLSTPPRATGEQSGAGASRAGRGSSPVYAAGHRARSLGALHRPHPSRSLPSRKWKWPGTALNQTRAVSTDCLTPEYSSPSVAPIGSTTSKSHRRRSSSIDFSLGSNFIEELVS